jgi:hypothetical protein
MRATYPAYLVVPGLIIAIIWCYMRFEVLMTAILRLRASGMRRRVVLYIDINVSRNMLGSYLTN